MDSNLPLSEQYRVVAKKWVDADAAANLLEDLKSAFLSQKMTELGDVPVSHAEREVKASAEWDAYIVKMNNARKQANLLKVNLEYIKMQSMEWQSENANRRAEMKL
jgi:hypothetical protein